MKRFMAVYTGTKEGREKWQQQDPEKRKAQERKGMDAWMKWGKDHEDAIVEDGAPLGKTKRVSKDGIADTSNNLAAYTIVEADSQEEAAKLFVNHPHFTIFPGDAVEIMECLPMPTKH